MRLKVSFSVTPPEGLSFATISGPPFQRFRTAGRRLSDCEILSQQSSRTDLRSGVARPVRGGVRAPLLCLNSDRETSARHQLPWTDQSQLGLKVQGNRAKEWVTKP